MHSALRHSIKPENQCRLSTEVLQCCTNYLNKIRKKSRYIIIAKLYEIDGNILNT